MNFEPIVFLAMNSIKTCCNVISKRCYATMRSPFQVLSVKESATSSEIKQKYKELAKQLHPDKQHTGDLAKFQELVQAYELLMDPNKKAYYLRTGQSWDAARRSPPPGNRPPSYTNAYWAEPNNAGTTRYASNTTFMSLLAGVILTIATFNMFYFHTSHSAYLSAADQHHKKSSQDLRKARTEAQLFGNDRAVKRVIDNRMKSFRKEDDE